MGILDPSPSPPLPSRRRWVALVALVLFWGCGSGDVGESPKFEDRQRFTADPAVATLILERLEAAEATPRQVGPWRDLGLAFEANGFCPEALEVFGWAAELAPGDGRTRYHLGVCQAQLGDLETAVERFREAAERSNDQPAIHWRRGEAELTLGRLDAAEESFEAALRIAPGSLPARVGRVRVALARGLGDDALLALGPLLANHPDLAILHHLMAAALRLEGRLDEVASHAARAGDGKVPEWPDPWQASVDALRRGSTERSRQGELALSQGRVDDALAIFRELATERPDDPLASANLAAALVAAGQYEEAIARLEPRVIGSAAGEGERFNEIMNLAAAYFLSGRPDDAEPLARRARALDPGKARPAEMLGAILLARGQGQEALESLRAAVRLDPRNATTQLRLAQACERLGVWGEAAEIYGRLVPTAPARVDLRLRWVRALIESGQSADATRQLAVARGLGLPEPLVAEAEALERRLSQ